MHSLNISVLDERFALVSISSLVVSSFHFSLRKRAEIVAYSFYFGAQQAIWKGYTPIISFLFQACRYKNLINSWFVLSISHSVLCLVLGIWLMRRRIRFSFRCLLKQWGYVMITHARVLTFCWGHHVLLFLQLQEASYFATVDSTHALNVSASYHDSRSTSTHSLFPLCRFWTSSYLRPMSHKRLKQLQQWSRRILKPHLQIMLHHQLERIWSCL